MIQKLKDSIIAGKKISFREVIILIQNKDKEALYKAADEIRQYFCGNYIDLCSITNAKSGVCSEDCSWCSQSAHFKTGVEEYEMVDEQQAVKEAIANAQKGVRRHSLVTSGRKVSNKTLDKLIPVYKKIGQESNIERCASMGLISKEQLLRLKNEAGITHYHCNLETAPSYFPKLCTTHTMQEKVETIKAAQALGIKVCSGGIIGMGESMEQRIELAFTLRDLGILSIPINILMPIKGTMLENAKPLTEEEILTTIALFRFINPTAQLRFAGGRLKLKSFQEKALRAGINAAITGDYLTTTGSDIEEDVREFERCGFSLRENELAVQ